MDYDITENIKNPLNGIMILVYMGYFLGLIFLINCSNKEVKEIEPEKEENKYLNEYNNLELDDIKDDRLKEIENNYIEEETENTNAIA